MTKIDGAMRPRARASVFSIDPYVPGKSSAPGVAKIYKLSSNETPLGPSPRAQEAFRAPPIVSTSIRTARRGALREAIGRTFGLDPARIVCGAGSDDLLHLLARPISARAMKAFSRSTDFSSTRSPFSPPAERPWSPRKPA